MSLAGSSLAEEFPLESSRSFAVPLTDLSHVGEARRLAMGQATRARLSQSESSNLGIVVTETASNAVRHATGGQVIFRTIRNEGRTGVEMLCLDRGPGIANVTESLRDGHSTAGSMGTGLGAANRLASTFEVFSVVGQGTVVLARVWGGSGKAPAGPLVTAVCLPIRGETECGDGWAAESWGARTIILAVDGLGHGVNASDAAKEAVRIFRENARRSPTDILDLLHRGLRSTRGAAAAVAEVDLGRRMVRYAGLGNIAGWVVNDDSMRAMVSHSGIVGHQVRKIQAFEYPLPQGGVIILHSDGLSSKWKASSYPGLLRRDSALLAGALFRDFARDRDDASVVIYRPPDSMQ